MAGLANLSETDIIKRQFPQVLEKGNDLTVPDEEKNEERSKMI